MTNYFISIFTLFLFILYSCRPEISDRASLVYPEDRPFIKILGIAQDAGFPQVDCEKECCQKAWKNPKLRRLVSCLGMVDPKSHNAWVFDATPNYKNQWERLKYSSNSINNHLAGIFLTHAHIGHYTGLMDLGFEVMGSHNVPVYSMPMMSAYLRNNGPWSQLVSMENIQIRTMKSDSTMDIEALIRVTPIQVPHRDEYSETVGFVIESDRTKVLFIPDINKWDIWDKDIVDFIKKVDYAFLDGSFFQNGEIPNRDMSQIAHPFITESIELFSSLDEDDRGKIHFIHFNHTNPLLDPNSKEYKYVKEQGYHLAKEGDIIIL